MDDDKEIKNDQPKEEKQPADMTQTEYRDERWKERIAFVIGTVAFWAIISIKTWQFLASYQFNANSQILRGSALIYSDFPYVIVLLVLFLGFGMIFFSIIYLFARGLWLAFPEQPEKDSLSQKINSILNRIGIKCYQILQMYLFITFVFISASILLLGTYSLTNLFGWPYWIAKISYFVFGSIPFVLTIKFLFGSIGNFNIKIKIRNLILPVGLAISVTLIISFVLKHTCYTAELFLNKTVFTQKDNALAFVNLGGQTYKLSDATLELFNECGNKISELKLKNLGAGKYTATGFLNNKKNGIYELILSYPHRAFTLKYPFFIQRIERVQRILLLP